MQPKKHVDALIIHMKTSRPPSAAGDNKWNRGKMFFARLYLLLPWRNAIYWMTKKRIFIDT